MREAGVSSPCLSIEIYKHEEFNKDLFSCALLVSLFLVTELSHELRCEASGKSLILTLLMFSPYKIRTDGEEVLFRSVFPLKKRSIFFT